MIPIGYDHTQSVSRALSLLTKLSEEPEGLNLSELARRVKLAPSTAHRLLTTLQLDQYVRFEDGRWLIGVQCFNVGSSYMRARDVCYMARPRHVTDIACPHVGRANIETLYADKPTPIFKPYILIQL